MKRPVTCGFTLVELLVVIVIIGTLSVLGFQGFRATKTQANKAVSAGNLRQLAAANLLYTADHQTYCPTDLNGRNLIRWHGGRPSTGAPFDPAKGLLADYLDASRQIGKCPQLERLINASAFNEDGAGGYGYNDTYIGGIPSEYLKANRPANVPNPTRTLMFATTAFAVPGGIQQYASAAPPNEVDTNWRLRGKLQPSVHFRFNGRALVAWCDGHITEESRSSDRGVNFYGGDNENAKIGFCGPAGNNGWWNPRN
jgi:prepilin-type N-terminal cleavage/methylation domain-containing protein/prepilin-type processing-associated H-X9-DG protein